MGRLFYQDLLRVSLPASVIRPFHHSHPPGNLPLQEQAVNG